MNNDDKKKVIEDYNPICDLTDSYMIYIRVLDADNGYNFMFTLLQDKKTKEYHGVARMRTPDDRKPFVGRILPKTQDRAGAISEFIGLTTKTFQGMTAISDELGEGKIIQDKSYEFTYGDDDEEMMKQLQESDLFNIRSVPL